MSGSRSAVSPTDTYSFFETLEPFKALSKRLGVSPNTLRKWWVEKFGQDAFDARGKALQAQAASKWGQSRLGVAKKLTETSEPCSVCGQPVVLNLNQKARILRILCTSCDEKERGVDQYCPVCKFGCVGVRGLAGHMARPQSGDPEAHAAYLCQQEQETWEGRLEDYDYVVCRVCGFRGKSLGNHIKLHNLEASSYYREHPGAALTASNTEVLRQQMLAPLAADRAFGWNREDLLKFVDEKGLVIVAEAALGLGAAPSTVLQYCKSFGLGTRNRLAWQRVVLDQAAKALGTSYEWEWSDPRIINPQTGRVLNFDGYFPSLNLIVEAHGDQHFRYAEAWHGSIEGFQESRERDAFKKKRAEELGFRFRAVRTSDPTHDPQFWHSLLAGEQPTTTIASVLSELRQREFPEVLPNEAEIQKALTRFASLDVYVDDHNIIRPYSTIGTAACASFFPNRYHAKRKGAKSVWEAWYDDETLGKAIKLQLDSGHPTTPERVVRALVMYHHAPSVFRPAVAKYVYQTFAPHGVVWDPCVGYGGRLLGAKVAGVSRYIGTDIEPDTVRGNESLAKVLQFTTILTLARAETFDPGEVLDLVFTSPSYFDLEIYGAASLQANQGYGTAQGWVRAFLAPLMAIAFRRLRPEGHLVLNLPCKPVQGIRLDQAAREVAEQLGFVEQTCLWMPVRSFRGPPKAEPILVWQRP